MGVFKKKKSEEAYEGTFARMLGSFVSALFIGKLNTLFVELLMSARARTEEYFRELIHRFSVALSAIVGVTFLLTGIAVYLNETLIATPGGGYLIVGGTLVLLSVVWYLVPGRK